MERLKTLQHGGVPILVVEYGGILDPQESLDLIRRSSEQIVAEPLGSVRVLMSVENAPLSPELLLPLKEAVLRNRPHVKGVAVVGLAGFLRTILQSVAHSLDVQMPIFDSREAALDWLAGL